jgi:hypothetical protein
MNIKGFVYFYVSLTHVQCRWLGRTTRDKYSCEGVMKKTHTIGNGTFILYDISSVVSLKLKSSRFCKSLLEGRVINYTYISRYFVFTI